MNQEALKLWIEDLRTTDAPQARGALSGASGFCCLGRLCEVAIKAGVPVSVYRSGSGRACYDGSDLLPPNSVHDWTDVHAWTDDSSSLFGACAGWNDNDYLTFAEIADKLEEYIV